MHHLLPRGKSLPPFPLVGLIVSSSSLPRARPSAPPSLRRRCVQRTQAAARAQGFRCPRGVQHTEGRVHHSVDVRTVSDDAGDAEDVEVGGANCEEEGESVVYTGVDVQPDGAWE